MNLLVELWNKKTQAAIHHAHDRGTKRTTFAAASGFSVTSTPGTLAISRPFARFNMLSVLTLLPLEEPGSHEWFQVSCADFGEGDPENPTIHGEKKMSLNPMQMPTDDPLYRQVRLPK